MFSFYIKSVIVYMIIFWALMKILKTQMANRKDVDYNKYAAKGGLKETSAFNVYYVYCFIPFMRILVIGITLFASFASKESLERLFNKENKYDIK